MQLVSVLAIACLALGCGKRKPEGASDEGRPTSPMKPVGQAASAGSAADGELQRRLEQMVASHAGKVSLFAKHLGDGRTVAIKPDQPVRSASVIKLLVLIAALEQVKAKAIAFTDTLPLTAEDQVSGSGVLWFLRPGLPLTLEDALSLMIIVSDNTATNLVIERIGVAAVNAVATRMGLQGTHLFRKVGKFPKVPDQNEKDFGLGKITPREAALLLESIDRCDLDDRALCDKVLKMLLAQQYRAMAPRYLEVSDEDRTSIGDKVGQLNQSRHDVALVYSKAGPLVVSVFTTDNQDARWTCENEAEQLIGRITKTIVDTWSPEGLRPDGPPQLATSSEPR